MAVILLSQNNEAGGMHDRVGTGMKASFTCGLDRLGNHYYLLQLQRLKKKKVCAIFLKHTYPLKCGKAATSGGTSLFLILSNICVTKLQNYFIMFSHCFVPFRL